MVVEEAVAVEEVVAEEVVDDDIPDEGPQKEQDEAVNASVVKKPGSPTQAERGSQEATHLLFRVWCVDCVVGRRDQPPTRPGTCGEHSVLEVLMGCARVRRAGENEAATVVVLKASGRA